MRGGFRAAQIAAALLALAAPTTARAQFFVQTETATTYVPLSNLPGVTQLTDFAFSSADEGRATLTLPFPFRFLGAPYNDVEIGVNGLLVFGGGYFGGYTNYPIGSYSSPENMIAVWWDDLILPSPAGHSSHGVLGTAPNRIFVIEVRDWEHYGLGNINDGRYQVWLYEGPLGRFEVRYDRLLTDTEDYSATAGWEGPNNDGEPNGVFRPCSTASPYCSAADYASMSARVFRVEQAQGPELLGTIGDFGRGARPGQSASVPVNLQNQGTEDAVNVTSELYLSLDENLDPATDIRVSTFATPLLAAGGSAVDVTVPATVPPGTPPGDYYLLLAVDAPDAHTEPSEQNNVVAAAGRFATAYELAPAAVATPGARPGQNLQVDLTVSSAALPYAGPITVALVASVDRILGPGDHDLGRVTATLTGAASEQVTLTVPLPATVPPGGFYLFADLDPDGLIEQLSRLDDRVIAADPFPTAANFVPVSVTGPPGATPGAQIDFELTVDNRGLDHVGLVTVRAIASVDPIYDLNDVVLGERTVDLTLGPGQSRTVTIPVTVPALRAGNYYPILLVDPRRQVPEVSDFDNSRVGDVTFATGADLVVIDLDGPAEAAPGDTVGFTVDVGSIGAPFTGAVGFALYLSADDVFDAQDVTMGSGAVTFAGQASLPVNLDLTFPAVPPGDYRVFVVVDPANQLVEADEANNVYLDRDDIETGPDFYIFGVDIDPRVVAPGDTLEVTGSFRNYGTPYTGPVEYSIYLSEDSNYDPIDLSVYDGVLTLAGETSLTLTATFAVAATTPPGDWDVVVVVNPRGLVPEQDGYRNEDDSNYDVTIEGANPTVTSLSGAPMAFTGRPYPLEVVLENTGGLPAVGVDVSILLSGVGVLTEGLELVRTATATIPAAGSVTLVATVDIPSDTPPGVYLLGTQVDPDRRLLETNERDNLALLPGGLVVMAPSADLQGRITATATAAAPGEPLAITRYVQNLGFTDAPSFELRYVLSLDDSLGPEDLVVGTSSVALAVGQDDLQIDVVDVPAGVPAGRYRLGLLVDAGDAVPEVDETDNTYLGPWLTVHEPGLRVLNAQLPVAVVGAPYAVTLFAAGATQEVGWSITQGGLPDGVILDQLTGELRGTPRVEGSFAFTVQVRSGGPVARRELVLRVVSGTVPLGLAPTTPLPGTVGRPYEGEVLAIGGQPPYRFSAVTAMPLGLTLAPDGRVTGMPEIAGPQRVRIRVDDGAAASASAEVIFQILRADHRVLITQSPLPVGRVDDELCDPRPIQVFASGGVPPYRWDAAGSPPGLVFEGDGTLCGAPTQAGTFTLEVRVTDAAGSADTSLFLLEVVPSDAFVVRTTALADAAPGEPYVAELEAVGGTDPLVWVLDLGTLPEGLTLSDAGRIEGTPTGAGAAFVVRVTDARGQSRRQPLSIRVVTPDATDDGGCRCVEPDRTPAAGLWVLGLLVATLRRRTRK